MVTSRSPCPLLVIFMVISLRTNKLKERTNERGREQNLEIAKQQSNIVHVISTSVTVKRTQPVDWRKA